MFKRLGVATAVVALSVCVVSHASAQFGKLGRALKNVARDAVAATQPIQPVQQVGTIEPAPGSTWEGNPYDKLNSTVPLKQLPAEFSKPNISFGDPVLTEASIAALIERDFAGVAKVKKLSLEREPGSLWTARKTTDGEVLSMWASVFINMYVQLKDGTCAVFMTGAVIEKPSLGFGNGFGEPQASDNRGPAHLNQPCNLS
jgi:hypothetical protein